MSDRALNDMMCQALIDGEFRDTLLADAANVVGKFDLDADERDILKTIRADSVTEFAQRLHTWMLERRGNNGHMRTYRRRCLVGCSWNPSSDPLATGT